MSKQIRLNDYEVEAIKTSFHRYFGEQDRLWLFGSRADLSKRGGDIDLYVETYCDNLAEIVNKKIKFLVGLKSDLGDQKIDVIVRMMSSHDSLPIYDEAKNSGVVLV